MVKRPATSASKLVPLSQDNGRSQSRASNDSEAEEAKIMQNLVMMEQQTRGIIASKKVVEKRQQLEEIMGNYENPRCAKTHRLANNPVYYKNKSRYQSYHEMMAMSDPMSRAVKADTIDRTQIEAKAKGSVRSVLRINDVKSVDEQIRQAGGDADAGVTTFGTSAALVDALSKFDIMAAFSRDSAEDREEAKKLRMAKLANQALYGMRKKRVDKEVVEVVQERQWTDEEMETMRRPLSVGVSKFDQWMEKQSATVKKSQNKKHREWAGKNFVSTTPLHKDWNDHELRFEMRPVGKLQVEIPS